MDRIAALLVAGVIVAGAPLQARAQIGPDPNPKTAQERLIAEGRSLFLNETFGGNGRTCATCHREDNNFTIDPKYIAGLPPNDPLFVAEFQPSLAANFENPVLMRKFGLIRVNPDGFGDIANRFVMRSVPHLLAILPNTLTPASADGTTIPPNERVGWGGDGAPGTGTLREMTIGQITQHFPKTLRRTLGTDFRLPTSAELDAIEAFVRSLGRREDLNLSLLSLKDPVASLGRRIFLNPSPALGGDPTLPAGNCNLCHVNAGASYFFEPGRNANFNTNVEGLPSQPADLVGQLNPQDGGFGSGISPTGGIGNGTFNTPSLVEAADTGPFFHNNAVSTIEAAVDHYNSDAFNKAPGFGGLITGNIGLISLQATELQAVASFLRVINTVENLRSAVDLLTRAGVATERPMGEELVRLAISELDDAIDVLAGGGLHPSERIRLREAQQACERALASHGMWGNKAQAAIDEAKALALLARAGLVN